ncbi:MAG TPA: histone deacetylase [Chthoniobacterales bacterium]|nr:histone deacetylase [Chthoniobacterales bacterium]
MIIFHDPRCVEYSSPGHPERPERITRTLPLLKDRHPMWKWREPRAATKEELLRAHSVAHIGHVKNPTRDFDLDTPAVPQIYDYALKSAGAGTEVARSALKGERTFVLNRPPGHHAMRDRAMGFCYFSNIAIAALDALENGAERVSIWDFDAHHGNGTEAIVAHNDRIRLTSIHQFPAYPGTGAKSFANIDNYPVAPFTPRKEHVDICKRALDKLIAFKPNLILVSAGFDAYALDPLVQMTLEAEDFATFGQWLRKIDIPAAALLEGGYSNDLPVLIDAFLSGWDG